MVGRARQKEMKGQTAQWMALQRHWPGAVQSGWLASDTHVNTGIVWMGRVIAVMIANIKAELAV